MNFLRQITELFACWIDTVAAAINAMFDRFGSQRQVQLIEGEHDTFTFHLADMTKNSRLPDYRVGIDNGAIIGGLPADWAAALNGSRTELMLRPSRFLFRPLELPKRAGEFLDGIVRSQIDRLTPWTANEAIYSWTAPVPMSNDRIGLTIAATARAIVQPYLQAITDLGAASIVVSTLPQNDGTGLAPIRVFEQRARSAVDVGRIRRFLVALFVLSGLSAAISIGVAAIVADSLETEQQDLARKITARRTAMRIGQDPTGGSAQRQLERRKQTTPSSVIVLEALSGLLPDHTYVTEFRVEGDKLQIVGITRDAPSLIQLIEQSPHFARATFFAPTTQSPGDPGERFHIEARIKPVFELGT
jgi:general secretion pathway protein L